MIDGVGEIVSIYEWYKCYHKESKELNNEKREYIRAIFGMLKIWFWFSIFSVVLVGISILVGYLLPGSTETQYLLVALLGMPLLFLFSFMSMIIIAILTRPKILSMVKNKIEVKNEFLSMIISGMIGWFESCVYLGVGKKERERIEIKYYSGC